MPLLGHAFTGMATALIVAPQDQKKKVSSQSLLAPFLTTSLIVLSYLPDIVSQCGLFFNWYGARQLGHSILFALFISPAAGFILNRQTSFTKKQCILLGLSTILLHDLLDILQSTDRQPFWPFSTTNFGSTLTVIPTNPTKEGLLFGLFYGIVLAWYLHRGQKKSSNGNEYSHLGPIPTQKLGEKILIILIILIALTTYHLRTQRIHTFRQAISMFHQQQYSTSLILLNKADRWPGIAKPGRPAYFKGVIYMKQHHSTLAEKYLLLSYHRNKNFFWCIGDLALLYATSNKPRSQRMALARPYIQRMRKDFSCHPDFRQYIQKIQNALINHHSRRTGHDKAWKYAFSIN